MQQPRIVFLVDDDLDDQEILLLVMGEISPAIECVFANDGCQALQILNNDTSFIPHLILVDMNMPRMNGTQLLDEIRKIGRLDKTKVYMYSTSAESRVVEQCLRNGADGFIRKQVDTVKMKEELQLLLRNERN